jgi:hypothetical protein
MGVLDVLWQDPVRPLLCFCEAFVVAFSVWAWPLGLICFTGEEEESAAGTDTWVLLSYAKRVNGEAVGVKDEFDLN